MEDEWLLGAFGDRLRQLRTQVGLTQEQLSDAAGISRTSIVNIERGRQGVSLTTLYRLADALGTERRSLLPEPPDDPTIKIAIGDGSASARTSVASVMQRIEEGGGSRVSTERGETKG